MNELRVGVEGAAYTRLIDLLGTISNSSKFVPNNRNYYKVFEFLALYYNY